MLGLFTFPDFNINVGGGEALQEGVDNLAKRFNDFLTGGFGGGSDSLRTDDPPFGGQPIEPPVMGPCGDCGTRISQDAMGNITTTCVCDGEEFIQAPESGMKSALEEIIPREQIDGPTLGLDQNPLTVQSEIDNQQFQGGGDSFIGGVVREIPISELSLGGIIDRFNVTASQAVNIQAEARNDFDNFDFGTNTGRGIGSVFARPDINTELPSGNISNPEFEGLTATEIARRLTGGVISNF